MDSTFISSVIFFEAILVFLNLPAILIGLKFQGNTPSKRLWFEPAGFLVPGVWILLFALLAILRSKLIELGMDETGLNVIGLAIVCALYPYYTLGLEKATGISAVKFGLIGNGLILIVSLFLAVEVGQVSPVLAYYVFPLVVWTAFTTFVLIGRLRLLREASLAD